MKRLGLFLAVSVLVHFSWAVSLSFVKSDDPVSSRVEVTFVDSTPVEAEAPPVQDPANDPLALQDPVPDEVQPNEAPDEERVRPEPERAQPEEPEEDDPEEPEPEPDPVLVRPQPQVPEDHRRSIEQETPDPAVAPPPNARFLAEQNRVVEEETVATLRNLEEDTAETSAGGGPESDEPQGTQDEQTLARQERDQAGDEQVREASSRQRGAEVGTQATRDQGAHQSHSHQHGPTQTESAPGTSTPQQEFVVVEDMFGRFRVRRPSAAGSAPDAETRRRILGGLSYSQYEALMGARPDAPAVAGSRAPTSAGQRARTERSEARGRGQGRFAEFRRALENYVPEVRAGNQTALNAAASPFAAFLAAMHRRIHPQFAERFLGSLPSNPTDPLNEMSLVTTLEIAINRDGTIHQVGVLESSGEILFDLGAYRSVFRGAPYDPPSETVLSGDGRAWLHWRFDRGPRQCHNDFARVFILNNGPVDRGVEPEPSVAEPPPETPSARLDVGIHQHAT